MRKTNKHFEINNINMFGQEERVTIVRASSRMDAVKKTQKSGYDLGDHIRVYPVKLTKKKNSSFW